MSLAELSIKRPIFISCVVIAILVMGYMSMQKLGVDLFPNVTFPVVTVTTVYPGAGPSEMENLVSRVLEDEISTVAGIKRMRSINKDSVSAVVAEFTLETDVKYAEQQVRDKVAGARSKLPADAKDPIIRRIDPADQPILILALTGDLTQGKLFDLADETIRPKIEQVNQVGLVEVIGGRKREIHVELDRNKLKAHEVSATQVANRIAAAGLNVPAGKVNSSKSETIFRTLGEFRSLHDIQVTPVNFLGNDVAVNVGQVGTVVDTLQDEHTRTYFNGQKSIFLMVYRQSGANTIAVVDAVRARVTKVNADLKSKGGHPELQVVRDGSKAIRANVDDVKESIFIGIFLTILVVFFFLGSGRSTLITGLALPNSLLGAFILMSAAGFTINIMTLLAMSLAVGLLIDDAIVVRENIFRHMELGASPLKAAAEGTKEVALAVLATTLTVIAVFGPIAFVQGVVGQFFKEFGLTICFAMCISLFDALAVAPMLSAYFAGGHTGPATKGLYGNTIGRLLRAFNSFQDWLEAIYVRLLHFTLKRPFVMIGGAVVVFVFSLWVVGMVPKTFLPAQDFGEFQIGLDMPPGTNLASMSQMATDVDKTLRENKEVLNSIMIVGNSDSEPNIASFFVELVPSKQRKVNTSQFKDLLRLQLRKFALANPTVKDTDLVAGGMRPFNVNIIGSDLVELEKISEKVFAKLRVHPGLKDVETSHKPGKPEFQAVVDPHRAEMMGVSSTAAGVELRNQIEGNLPAVFRENGREYDIRVRLQDDQRDLQKSFSQTYIPNINSSLVHLSGIAQPVVTQGPSNINRQDRGRYIQISADITPNGPGMGAVMKDIDDMFQNEIQLPPGMTYAFVGQAENFSELLTNMKVAAVLAVLFIYLVLASLYESFITPWTIMLVLPLAACGAFIALYLAHSSLDVYSMIGCIMLLGVATKNSILLVDSASQHVREGMNRAEAVIQAGKTRLRPILMTTFALVAGMLPVAIGLNEASKQRTSMGIAVIGGLISSTILSLVVVPAAFSYIDRFKVWLRFTLKNLIGPKQPSAVLESVEPALVD